MRINKEIISITSGPRQANFEVLRILAMFLVLVYHADFWTIGKPNYNELSDDTFPTLTRIFIESLSVVCVNVFVMISGWFKIKASLKGFLNFIFQCLFFSILLYAIAVISGHSSVSFKGLMECLYLTPLNWFVKAYLALYIVSPVLNAFIEKTSELKFRHTLIALFSFEFIFGISGAADFIHSGLSCYSFICLYLLSSYIRMHICPRYTNNSILKWGG